MRRHGVRLGVVLSDTAGRPWRVGQVDFALGAHGLRVLDDLRGAVDADGRDLSVTARALADEVAAAADLVKGKVLGVPAAIVRGLADVVLDDDVPVDEAAGGRTVHPGAGGLVRAGRDDWFGHGQVEAVRAALGVPPGSPQADEVGIPPAGPETRAEAVARAVRLALAGDEEASADVGDTSVTLGADGPYELGRLVARLQAALWCDGLEGEPAVPAADGCSVVVRVAQVVDAGPVAGPVAPGRPSRRPCRGTGRGAGRAQPTVKTTLPKTSPSTMRAKPSRASASGRTESMTGSMPACTTSRAS